MTQHSKVLVVGAGLVGLCVAKALAQRQFDVTVIASDWGAERASYGNAGHIATEQVDSLADPAMLRALPARLFSRGGPAAFPLRDIATWLPFGLRYLRHCTPACFRRNSQTLESLMQLALPAWQRLAADLGEPQCLKLHGHRVVYESTRSASKGLSHWLNARCGNVTTHELGHEHLDELEQALRVKLYGGIQFVGSGQVTSPPEVLRRTEEVIRGLGVTCVTEQITGIRAHAATGYTATSASGNTFTSQHIVIAAGAQSHRLLKPLGLSVPLIAERGYHLEGVRGAAWTQPGPVVFEDRHVVVSGFGERLRATSFVEFASERSPPDFRKWQRLNRHLDELGVPMGAPRHPWMGARPTLPDYLPAIGAVSGWPGLWTAFGHQHLGLTLAPITAEILAPHIQAHGSNSSLDWNRLSLDRFQ